MKNNKKMAQRALSLIALLVIVAGTVLPVSAQRRRPRVRRPVATRRVTPAVRYYTLNTDQTMRVRLDNELNSGTARVGDRFSTTTVDPIYADGVEVIPAGSKVLGRVKTVNRAGRRTPGNISVSFISVVLPNRAAHAINGSLTDMQGGNDNVNADNESTVEGKSNRKRDAIFIGGGLTSYGLLTLCRKALRRGGRLVVNVSTVEGETLLSRAQAERGGRLRRLSTAYAEPLGGFTGWRAARPVTQYELRVT